MENKTKKKIIFGLIIAVCVGIGLSLLLIKGSIISLEESSLTGGIVSSIWEAVTIEKPSEVVLAYYKALRNKNYSRAAGYLTEGRKKELELGTRMEIEEVMKLVAEENEKAGYTKIEIIKEDPIAVRCLVMVKCSYCKGCSGTGEEPYYDINVIKEGDKWRISADVSSGGCFVRTPLPGKIEISPSPDTPQWVALQYFKSIFEGNYLEAKKYLPEEGEEFIKEHPGIAKDYFERFGEVIGEHPLAIIDYLEQHLEKLDEKTKEEITEEILKFFNEQIKEDEVESIKGVIVENIYVRGELKTCAEDVYCDEYRFEVQKENDEWKVASVEPE